MPHEERERRDGLRSDVQELTARFNEHIENEKTALGIVNRTMQELGDHDEVRTRRIFIEAWIAREEKRNALIRAVIEKSTVVAVAAIVVFVAKAVWAAMVSLMKGA